VLGSIIDLEENYSGNPFRWSPTLKRKNPSSTFVGASNETSKNECAMRRPKKEAAIKTRRAHSTSMVKSNDGLVSPYRSRY